MSRVTINATLAFNMTIHKTSKTACHSALLYIRTTGKCIFATKKTKTNRKLPKTNRYGYAVTIIEIFVIVSLCVCIFCVFIYVYLFKSMWLSVFFSRITLIQIHIISCFVHSKRKTKHVEVQDNVNSSHKCAWKTEATTQLFVVLCCDARNTNTKKIYLCCWQPNMLCVLPYMVYTIMQLLCELSNTEHIAADAHFVKMKCVQHMLGVGCSCCWWWWDYDDDARDFCVCGISVYMYIYKYFQYTHIAQQYFMSFTCVAFVRVCSLTRAHIERGIQYSQLNRSPLPSAVYFAAVFRSVAELLQSEW